MAVIDYTDVATVIGRPISTTAEQEQISQWIDDVELVLGARLGDLAERDEALLQYVVRESVIARMRHRSESSDDDNNRNVDENFFLRVLGPWWSLLDQGDTGSDAFSARPYFVPDAPVLESWA